MTRFYKLMIGISLLLVATLFLVLLDARLNNHPAGEWITLLVVSALGLHIVGWAYQMWKTNKIERGL